MKFIIPLLAGLAFSSSAGAQTPPAAPSDAAMEEIVKRVIRDNPQLIIDSLRAHEERVVAQAREEGMKRVLAVMNDPSYPRIGDVSAPPSGVVFLDYNCGYCRRTHPEILSWLAAQPGRSLTVIELPVLGPGSVAAASVALAAVPAGAYERVSNALFKMEGPIKGPEDVKRMLEKEGIDADSLMARSVDQKISETLRSNMELAQVLGINGTPAAIINGQLTIGAFTAADMDNLVSSAKKN